MKETGIIMSGDHPKLILDGLKTQTRRTYGLEKVNKNPDDWEVEAHDGATWVFRNKTSGVRVFTKCPYGSISDLLWCRETWAAHEAYDGRKPSDIPEGVTIECKIEPDAVKTDGNGHRKIREGERGKWRPSIFMPRWASRITREITDLRAERLQEITNEDAEAEGATRYPVKISQGRVYQALTDYSYEAYPLKWGFEKGERLKADFPSLGLARFYSLDKKDGQCIHLSPKEAFSLLEDEAMTYRDAFANLWDSLNAKRGYSWDFNPWVWPISF